MGRLTTVTTKSIYHGHGHGRGRHGVEFDFVLLQTLSSYRHALRGSLQTARSR